MSPRKHQDPVRSFRIPDDLYNEAKRIADENDDSLAEIVREALTRYVKRSK